MASDGSLVRMSVEVADALAAGRPCVALESTIVAHGMPWPQNYEAALAVEAKVPTKLLPSLGSAENSSILLSLGYLLSYS